MPVKINSLEVENVKRVKAVALEPAESGLTVIGGRNGQGKTSVLDAISWALGGDRKRPSEAKRAGSATDPRLKVELSNGIVVERKGKNGSLRVTDPEGRKGGQQLLDSFVEALALDLPRFLAMSDKDKARTLLGIIGVGEELARIEAEEQALYNRRTGVGQMRDVKRGAAEDMPAHPDAPREPVSALELIQAQQAILARNGENQRMRENAAEMRRTAARSSELLEAADERVRMAEEALSRARAERAAAAVVADQASKDAETAGKSAQELADESTAEIEAQLEQVELVNAKVRDNQRRADAMREAEELDDQYREMTARIEELRSAKMALLDGADLPLPGLAVDNGLLAYEGRRWDCMSGSEQLRVATAIVRRLKPECGFVLVDKLEQMDAETLREFGEWAEGEGLQVIATRVSVGDECSIVIEDGYGGAGARPENAAESAPGWADAPAVAPAAAPVPILQPADKWVM